MQEEKQKLALAEAQKRQLEHAHQQANSKLQAAVKAEREAIAELRQRLATVQSEVMAAVEAEEARAAEETQRLAELEQRASDVNSSVLQERIDALEAQVTELQNREKTLTADMKKKGDLARTIVTAKEEEVNQLRTKLQQMMNGGGAGGGAIGGKMNPGVSCFPQGAVGAGAGSGSGVVHHVPAVTEHSHNETIAQSQEASTSASGPQEKHQIQNRRGFLSLTNDFSLMSTVGPHGSSTSGDLVRPPTLQILSPTDSAGGRRRANSNSETEEILSAVEVL